MSEETDAKRNTPPQNPAQDELDPNASLEKQFVLKPQSVNLKIDEQELVRFVEEGFSFELVPVPPLTVEASQTQVVTGALSNKAFVTEPDNLKRFEEEFFEEQIDQIISKMDKTIERLDQNSQKLSQSRNEIAKFRDKNDDIDDITEFR